MAMLAQLDGLLDPLADPRVRKAVWITIVWLVTLGLTRLNGRFFDRVDARLSNYNVPERRLAKLDFLMDVLLLLLAVFITLHLLGVSQALWGAVAVTGIAGAMIALAAQRLGQNILAGLVILFERPFILGDVVEVGGRTGSVQKVTLHSTTLETPDGPKAIIPNSEMVNATIVNKTATAERRVVLTIDVTESVDLDRVRRVLGRAVESERHLVADRPVHVFAKESLDEGVRFEVRYWVRREHYTEHCLPSAMARMLDALNEAELGTAVPAQKVYVDQG